jgi:hypothetical protein
MTVEKAAELLSLGMTPATIILSLWVVKLWAPKAWSLLSTKQHRDSVGWFIVGVTLGFIGAAFDNLYWGFAWSASFLGLPSEEWWFSNGVFSNIPFRQGLGMAAAFCHVKSAKEMVPKSVNCMLWVCLIVGACFVLALSLAKQGAW